MNALKRSPKVHAVTISENFKLNPQHPKIEAARKELFVISETAPGGTSQPSNKKQKEQNDFNLFNFIGDTGRTNCLSPLISSGNILRGGLNMNLLSQPYTLSHSISQQAASLSTNSSHSEYQRGGYMTKNSGLDIFGKPLVGSTFRLNDGMFLPAQLLENNFLNNFKNEIQAVMKNAATKSKSPVNKGNKTRPRNGKKSRSKSKKVTVEEYVRHVKSREESNLTIDEAWEESEDWDDIEADSDEEKTHKVQLIPVKSN